MFEVAAEHLQRPVERLDAADGSIYDEDDPGVALSFVKAVQLAEVRYGALVAAGSYAPPEDIHGDYKGAGVGPSPAYSYSTCVAQVAVDEETGEVNVEKLWLAHDVGQSINPLLVAGQVEGGAYMGYGEAVMEQQVFRKGRHKIPSLLDYKLPTTLDTPEIETILIEIPDREGPFGGKEAGQGPLNPVIPAIANAVYDAVGIRIDETPITPDKVLRLLRAESGQARASRSPTGDAERSAVALANTPYQMATRDHTGYRSQTEYYPSKPMKEKRCRDAATATISLPGSPRR